MKFDILNWNEVKPNEESKAPKGRLFVRTSQEAAFYLSLEGYEVLAGTGKEIDVTFKEDMTFRIEAPKDTRCFIYEPVRRVHSTEAEEVFTNIDRKPQESGNLLEVKKAMRQMQLMHYQMRKETEEANRMQLARMKAARPAVAPEPEPQVAAEEPTPEAEKEAAE